MNIETLSETFTKLFSAVAVKAERPITLKAEWNRPRFTLHWNFDLDDGEKSDFERALHQSIPRIPEFAELYISASHLEVIFILMNTTINEMMAALAKMLNEHQFEQSAEV